jgi:hypothetical protein
MSASHSDRLGRLSNLFRQRDIKPQADKLDAQVDNMWNYINPGIKTWMNSIRTQLSNSMRESCAREDTAMKSSIKYENKTLYISVCVKGEEQQYSQFLAKDCNYLDGKSGGKVLERLKKKYIDQDLIRIENNINQKISEIQTSPYYGSNSVEYQ